MLTDLLVPVEPFRTFSETVLNLDVDDAIVAAPHAVEATGDNAIPQVWASTVQMMVGKGVDDRIVQTNQVFRTGADPMERLTARASFAGPVVAGGRYILVDDVMTMGGTLADFADDVRTHGGNVAAVILLVCASRTSARAGSARRSANRGKVRFPCRGHLRNHSRRSLRR